MPATIKLFHANHGNAFRAYTLRDSVGRLGPFIGVDHAWMSAPTFPAHSHTGLSAVSYVFLDSETGIINKDSLGNRNIIKPGGLHWATAGRGIIHQEDPSEPGKTVHSLQIFVGLSDQDKKIAPFALTLEPQEIPVVQLPGAKVRVVAGNYGEVYSPLTPPTKIKLLDVLMEPETEMTIMTVQGECTFIMPIFGTIKTENKYFNHNDLLIPVFYSDEKCQEIRFCTTQDVAKVVVFSGQPLRHSLP